MSKKKIIVLDDEPLIAVLMKEIIEEEPGMEITHIVSETGKILDLVDRHRFDTALIDISVGGREGGLELLQAVKNKGIPMPLIILSAHDELHYALKCLQAGAQAYISKRYICTDVVKCIKQVLDGHFFVSGEKGEQILKQYRPSNATAGVESQ